MAERPAAEILVVDDTPENLRLLAGILSRRGYRIRPAASGTQALATVRQGLPDLILLDIMMPNMSGLEVCEQLKADKDTRDIPIIFISALDETLDKVQALQAGGVDYISKPFQAEEVVARVETHLALRAVQRELELEVSERNRAERTVQEQNAFLQLVLDSVVYPLYVINAETYAVEMANAAALASRELANVTCHALVHQNSQPCRSEDQPCPLGQVKSTKRPVVIEHVHADLDGDPRHVEVHGFPILNEDGDVVRMLEYAVDVTDRMKTEKRLRLNEARLAALQEREKIGRELHDDLAQVIGYIGIQAQAAMDHLDREQTAQAKAALERLGQAAQIANADVRQTILGTRPAAPSSPDANGGDAFFAALNHHLDALRQRYGLKVNISLPDDLLESPIAPQVATKLLRIIQEALTNVAVHSDSEEARILLTLHTSSLQAIIEDEGRGFDPISLEMPTRENGGHFGLQIMRERAESAGGSLEVRSAVGAGTRVIVEMPLSLQDSDDFQFGHGVRLLLVDDHPLYLEGLHSLLASRGLQVVGKAHDGLAGLELARSLQPDLILMDVRMPRCDGIEATRRIKAEMPETKVVMLTTVAEDETLFKALKSGASGYLLKNLAGAQFFALLSQAIEGETVLSPSLASRVLAEFAHRPEEPATEPEIALTARQMEVLKLVTQGLSNKEIAAALLVSERTVKYHVGQILERLQLRSRHQMAQYAREQGLAPLDKA